MTQKGIFFTAGSVPTTQENTDFARLQTLAAAFFTWEMRNGAVSPNHGLAGIAGGEDADLVAGTIPAGYGATGGAYEDGEAVETQPIPGAGGAAVVYDGQEIGLYTVTITAGVVSIEETSP